MTRRFLIRAGVIGATTGLAAALCYFTWSLIRAEPDAVEQPAQTVAINSPLPVQSEPARPVDPAVSLLGSDSSISPEALELVLVATAPGRTPREGTATLGTDPRNPQTYAAGARLVNGALIAEIHADHIVLELKGKRTRLAVGGKTLGEKLARFAGSSSSDAIKVGGEASTRKPLDNVASSREDLSEIIRPEPVFDDRGFIGLKILPGRNRSKLESLGLQSGDIVRTIDGKPLRSPDAAWQALDDAISTGTSIVVSIERDGTLASVMVDGSRIIEPVVQTGSFEPPGPRPPGT